jgi:hypothetical protein
MEGLPSRPYFVEHFHEAIVQHERDCYIQAYTTQSRNCTFVKPATQYLQLACKTLVAHSLIISWNWNASESQCNKLQLDLENGIIVLLTLQLPHFGTLL